jgi:serine/threonine protein kinase
MSGITMAGDMAGTFAYMPPEQIKDFRNVKPTSDIYAIGMTAYSLLAGDTALDTGPAGDMAATVRAIFEGKSFLCANEFRSARTRRGSHRARFG